MISISSAAAFQLSLMIENDFTLEGKVLRLSIDGKECNGFTYALGFTSPHENDVIYPLHFEGMEIALHMDPLVVAYCKNGKIDYWFDPIQGIDLLYFENEEQKQFEGKFFKNKENIRDINL